MVRDASGDGVSAVAVAKLLEHCPGAQLLGAATSYAGWSRRVHPPALAGLRGFCKVLFGGFMLVSYMPLANDCARANRRKAQPRG